MVCQRPLIGVYPCPSSGHSGIKCRASTEQAMGTHCPYRGQWVPKVSDDFGALLAGRRLWLYVWCFMTILWCFMAICDASMEIFMILLSILWYFNDTFCKVIRKVSFFYLVVYLVFISKFGRKDETLRLFSRKNFFRVRIGKAVNL